MTTVRLPADIEQRLESLAEKKKISKSNLIKDALEKYFCEEESEKDSFEIGEEYFGRYGSGDGSLSVSYKQKIKDKLNERRNSY